jgi:CBS-domain-containing membrane protein
MSERSGWAQMLSWLVAGLGSGLAIYALAMIESRSTLAALVPSFGASCALVFAYPQSPFAQPRNVIGGHLVSSGVGLLTMMILGTGPAAMAVGVGLAIAGMMATETMHPPAGGDPLLVMIAGASISFLVTPILLGTVLLVLIGVLFHRCQGVTYPLGSWW